MISRPYNNRHIVPAATIGVILIIMAMMIQPAYAADKDKKTKNPPIRITADQLVVDNQNQSARFSGNAKAVQGKAIISADSLTIIYKSGKEKSPAGVSRNIERIKANGNVRIELDNRVAVSNQAVYTVGERKLVLTGPESKIIRGKDEIIASKITFYRDTGNVEFDSDPKKPVEAIIRSDQRGLN